MCLPWYFINRDKTDPSYKLNHDYNLALTWVTILNFIKQVTNLNVKINNQYYNTVNNTDGKLTEHGDKYYSFSIHKCDEWCKY